MRLPGHPGAVREARRALDKLTDRLDPPVLDDLRLLVSEVVTNSVRHSPVRGDRDCIDLAVFEAPSAVRVEVEDPGPGFTPRVHPPTRDQSGGWGLYLVDRLASDWGVRHSGKTKVWFTVPTHPQTKAS